jgi:hypothetical protein
VKLKFFAIKISDMSYFSGQTDYNYLCSFFNVNVNEQVQKLANEARDGTLSQRLTGKELLKRILECKSDNHDIIDIDSAMNEIWNSRLTTSQKRELVSIADNINKARNAKTIELITRINVPQITKTDFEDSFFNGTSLYDKDNLESSILPLGTAYGEPFQ